MCVSVVGVCSPRFLGELDGPPSAHPRELVAPCGLLERLLLLSDREVLQVQVREIKVARRTRWLVRVHGEENLWEQREGHNMQLQLTYEGRSQNGNRLRVALVAHNKLLQSARGV